MEDRINHDTRRGHCLRPDGTSGLSGSQGRATFPEQLRTEEFFIDILSLWTSWPAQIGIRFKNRGKTLQSYPSVALVPVFAPPVLWR